MGGGVSAEGTKGGWGEDVPSIRTPNATGPGPCVFVRASCPRASGVWRQKGELVCALCMQTRAAGKRGRGYAFNSRVLLLRELG